MSTKEAPRINHLTKAIKITVEHAKNILEGDTRVEESMIRRIIYDPANISSSDANTCKNKMLNMLYVPPVPTTDLSGTTFASTIVVNNEPFDQEAKRLANLSKEQLDEEILGHVWNQARERKIPNLVLGV